MSKCGTSQFDKDEMLPLVDSLMYAKMEALNRRYEEDASKVQLEGLTEVYSSFTSLELSLEAIAKKSIFNEWKQLKSNTPLTSSSYNRVKQQLKQECQQQVQAQNERQQQDLQECNNQKRE